MKKIVLHGPSTDEAGNFCDAGDELRIVAGPKDAGQAGFISAERARELVDRGGALSATASAELEKAASSSPAKPRRAAKPRAKKAATVKAPSAEPAPRAAAPAKTVERAGRASGGAGETGPDKA